jgi:hypothetical protein
MFDPIYILSMTTVLKHEPEKNTIRYPEGTTINNGHTIGRIDHPTG